MWQHAGRGGGRCGAGQENNWTWPAKVGGGDAGSRGADIQRLGEFNELRPGGVDCPQEHGHLETDAR